MWLCVCVWVHMHVQTHAQIYVLMFACMYHGVLVEVTEQLLGVDYFLHFLWRTQALRLEDQCLYSLNHLPRLLLFLHLMI